MSIVLLCFPFVQATEFVVFNVGQGNCNLFAPNKGTPVLYDAGSIHKAENLDGTIDRATVISEISDRVESLLEYNKMLNVVISHGDRDHYNYIEAVLANLPLVTFHFFFGGLKEQYPSKFIKALESIPPVRRKTFCFADAATLVDPVIGDSYVCKVLARPVMDDKNASSLVLKIRHAMFSILLMGDATHETTQMISDADVTGTTILVANHHGSATLGSNNDAWVIKAKPEIAVFSASKSNHGHPTNVVVMRYLNSQRLRVESLHEFSYSGILQNKPPELVTYHTVAETIPHREYYRALTRKAIFNTMNEGTMLFRLNDPIIRPRPDKPFFSMFPLRGLMELTLSKLEITNEEFMLIAPKLYVLQLLKSLDLSKNCLELRKPEGSKAINAVKELLDTIATITKISFLENECSSEHMKEIISDKSMTKLELPSEKFVAALKK